MDHKELLLTYIQEYLLFTYKPTVAPPGTDTEEVNPNLIYDSDSEGDDVVVLEEIARMIIERLVENKDLKSLLKL